MAVILNHTLKATICTERRSFVVSRHFVINRNCSFLNKHHIYVLVMLKNTKTTDGIISI